MRLPLKRKFSLLTAGFVITICVVIAINFISAQTVSKELDAVNSHHFPRYALAISMESRFKTLSQLIEDTVVIGELSLLERSAEEKDRLIGELDSMEAIVDETDRVEVQDMRSLFGQYYQRVEHLAEQLVIPEDVDEEDGLTELSSLTDDSVRLQFQEAAAFKQQLEADLERLVENQRTRLGDTLTGTVAGVRLRSLEAFGIGSLSFVVMMMVLIRLGRNITIPIVTLSQITKEVAAGNFDRSIDLPFRPDDEVGDLTTSFEAMTKSLTETTVSKSYVDNILRSMQDALLVTDEGWKVQRVNNAALELLGHDRDEVLGRKLRTFLTADAMFKQATGTQFTLPQMYQMGLSEDGIRNVETTFVRKDGSEIPVLFSASLLTERDDETGFVCLARDITSRKTVEEELRLAKDAAEDANHAKSSFLANMSHELRTPLNAILGYSEMLKEEAEDLEQNDFVPDLEKIHAAGKHLLGLINDVLDLSKIEAGRMELYLETMEVTTIVNDVISTVTPLVEKNGNRLRVICPDDIGSTRTDVMKLRQSLLNLMSNASKFTEKGDITLSAAKSTQDGREWISFAVQDSGIGMSKEQLGKLFQAFQQADASTTRKYGGTGLGLAISRRFCQMMGGDITVSSEPGEGSCFTVLLPLMVVDESKTSGEQLAAQPSEPAVDPVEGSILVIDDDPSVRELVERSLGKQGLSVLTASSGEEGIKLAKAHRPDVITLDVHMPGMDGWATLRALKDDTEIQDIPVIMMTMVDEKNMGYSLGAAEYLTKPIDRNRLMDALSRFRDRASTEPVLVVEDDGAVREVIRRTLSKEGLRVVEAKNGKQAVACLQERSPSLILLDLMMPEMDGFGVVDELQKNSEWKDIPVVVITAKDITEEERQRLNGVVEAVITKSDEGHEHLLSEMKDLIAKHLGTKVTA